MIPGLLSTVLAELPVDLLLRDTAGCVWQVARLGPLARDAEALAPFVYAALCFVLGATPTGRLAIYATGDAEPWYLAAEHGDA